MKKRSPVPRTKTPGATMRCWEFFRCSPERQKACLMRDVGATPCWALNLACCQMPQDAARPISIKKVICKNCAFYIYAHKKTR